MLNDIICALATARGRGGIAVIRVSGKGSIGLVKKIFKSKKDLEKAKGYTIIYGSVMDKDEKVDDCLVSVFRAPHSYTGEDVCEISCHGGVIVTERIISLLMENGARIADRGEFTKRAFMNGKISLTQAEAVKDIIDAKTEKAASTAVNRLSGALSEKISAVRDKVIKLLASVQVSTDFPDEDTDAFAGGKLTDILDEISLELGNILKSAKRGIYLASGAECAIAGLPNVGKSSLLNTLVGEEKAIVTDIEGTTRDALEVGCDIDGVFLKFIDTAGIRETDDTIEKIGVDKAKKIVDKADIVIFLTESGRSISKEEEEIVKNIPPEKRILVLNKCDKSFEKRDGFISISAKTGEGIDMLKKEISRLLEEGNSDSAMIANERQREAVSLSAKAIERAKKTLDDGFYSDLAVVDIMDCASFLGEADGMNVTDEVIDRIFKEFCLGK